MHKSLLEVNDSHAMEPKLRLLQVHFWFDDNPATFSHGSIHHSLILILSCTLNLPCEVIFLFLSDGGLPVVNAFLHFFLIPKCLIFTLILEGYFPWVEDLGFSLGKSKTSLHSVLAFIVFWGVSWMFILMAQMVKNLPAMQETQVQSLDWGDALKKGMATHSSILAWRIPWTEEAGRLTVHGS